MTNCPTITRLGLHISRRARRIAADAPPVEPAAFLAEMAERAWAFEDIDRHPARVLARVTHLERRVVELEAQAEAEPFEGAKQVYMLMPTAKTIDADREAPALRVVGGAA